MQKKLRVGFAVSLVSALIAWELGSALKPIRDDATRPHADGAEGRAQWIEESIGEVPANPPKKISVSDAAPTISATQDKIDLLEQEKRIAKLRRLHELLQRGHYRVAHLQEALSSGEGTWLKAAYIQAAWHARWTGDEADQAIAESLSFLESSDHQTSSGTMPMQAYHISMQLMADLNRRSSGKYDDALKERFEKTGNPDYLKTIFDLSYKLEKIINVPPRHAVAIVRESPTPEYVKFAKGLLVSSAITAEDRSDLSKYLAQYGSRSEWSVSRSDNRKTMLMKLNGVAASHINGKVQYIYSQWLELFFSRITDDLSHPEWRALPNPTFELAQTLWTEEDQSDLKKVKQEILGLFAPYHIGGRDEPFQRKKRALVNLATSYLDLCLSNLVSASCHDELSNPESFGATLARVYLGAYLERPDAEMALGKAKAYVEKMRTKKSANLPYDLKR